MNRTVFITGANTGIGKDTARQLALKKETEKIYLGCRNESRAKAAKQALEEITGRKIFDIVLIDVSDPKSVRTAVDGLKEPIDALIMNAGGIGGKTPGKLTKDGVTQIFATNVLGHVVLLEKLIEEEKLNNVALYASSEAVRGIGIINRKQSSLKTSSVDEFSSIIDGSYFGGRMNTLKAYGLAKYIATLWMSSQARKHPAIRLVSMSPGGTTGTAIVGNYLPGIQNFMLKYTMIPSIISRMGLAHSLETGAARFVNGINDPSLKSGVFYGSKKSVLTGPIIDQSTIFPNLSNTVFQDNADEAIHRFIR